MLSYLPGDIADGVFDNDGLGQAAIARDGTWTDDTALPTGGRRPCQACSESEAPHCHYPHHLRPQSQTRQDDDCHAAGGAGVQKARKRADENGKAELYLEDMRVAVPLAAQYTHLGVVLDARVTLQAESTLGALGYGDQGTKLLFQNRTIPLQVRAQLFEVAVRSTLFNAAIWIPEGEAWQRLSGGYSRCLRRLLSTAVTGGHLFRLPLPLVHVATGSWRLELVAVRSRMALR